jgi:hypothetical protein
MAMKPTTKKQIKNGLRLGGGIGALLIAAMMIGVAIEGLQDIAPAHLRLWPDVAIATGLIGAAAVIMTITSRIWILYIGGSLLVAIPKFLMVAMSGRNFYSSHESFSSLRTTEFVLFSLVSLFLIHRVTVRPTPGIVDRLAFMFFFFALIFGLSQHDFAVAAVWQLAGVTGLWLAWFLSRKKHGSRRGRTTIRTNSAINEARSRQL